MPTLTHFNEDARNSNPKAALVRVAFQDAQGYGNQRRHDLRIGAQPGYVNGDLRAPACDLRAEARKRFRSTMGRGGEAGGSVGSRHCRFPRRNWITALNGILGFKKPCAIFNSLRKS